MQAYVTGNLNQAGIWVTGIKNQVQHEVSDKLHSAQTYVSTKADALKVGVIDTAAKTKAFVIANKATIFFVGCSAITAVFFPEMFFAAAIVTIIVRVELNWLFKKLAAEYLKDDHNPYLLNPYYGPDYVTPLTVTMATVAAVDSLALGTIFVAGSMTVALLPVLGGIAVGSVVAKLGIDMAQRISNISFAAP